MIATRQTPPARADAPPCGTAAESWPRPPIRGSARLIPITSWSSLWEESRAMQIECEPFWVEQVEARAAYFFRWLGEPRATVLVIWDREDGLQHVECRAAGDRQLDADESLAAVEEVHRLFAEAGIGMVAAGFA